jgi:hypothetical protein
LLRNPNVNGSQFGRREPEPDLRGSLPFAVGDEFAVPTVPQKGLNGGAAERVLEPVEA